jgi:hypothetical protein
LLFVEVAINFASCSSETPAGIAVGAMYSFVQGDKVLEASMNNIWECEWLIDQVLELTLGETIQVLESAALRVSLRRFSSGGSFDIFQINFTSQKILSHAISV